MMRTYPIHCLALALMCGACGSTEKACRRAEGKVHQAFRICPELAQVHTDTVVITVPGDSVTMAAAYAEPVRDSLVAVITQLHDALIAERELFALTPRDTIRIHAPVARALSRARRHICYYPPTSVENETARGMMGVDSTGRPWCRCWAKPRKGFTTFTHQPVVAGPVKVVDGISALERLAYWMGWVVAVVFVGLFIRERSKRLSMPPFQ